MPFEKVLVVDDDPTMRNFLMELLKRKKLDVKTAQNGKEAISNLNTYNFDLVITDMKLGDLTGFDVLKKTKELHPEAVVIVITAFGSIENAVDTIKGGAFNYLIKPFSPDSLEAMIDKAGEHLSLVAENQYLRQQVSQGGRHSPSKMICESPVMKKILKEVQLIAKSHASVLITGESGTGKEVIAQAIHTYSDRETRPFIKVNCAAVPETLMESEFFGHEKGAFTGANAKRLGRFELANTGTLLLDEVTEIPLGLQAKMLRVIQEQEFERVGGTKPVKVNVRLVSTSNRSLQEAIAQKILREDLYYRLNVVPIYLPPLRERNEDILPLARYFLERLAIENKSTVKQLTPDAEKKLLSYKWPGNVRELSNIIERAVVMSDGKALSGDLLSI